jgi:DNA polymerase-3 subunit epsilon
MFNRIYQAWQKRYLKVPEYQFLFEPATRAGVVSVDCETTGLNPKKDDIITLAAIRIIGNDILTSESIHLTLRPNQPINSAAITIHRLRNCDVANGLEPEEAIKQFLDFIGSSPLLGYYLEFDVALINRIIKPWLGIKLPNEQIELSALYHDKVIGLIPQHHIDLRFETIRKKFNIPDLGAHDAFADALMVSMAYIKLKNNVLLKQHR